ncbi:MAG TPA: M14 family metallopeptidase [Vicinamibacterales bacterium]|nr:M14 family metallopeptidase [Vicinamibacterales bacterium]
MTPSAAFAFGSVTVPPGSIVSGMLDVPVSGTSPASFVPFSVLHGTSPGPVLALVAGVHGMEYAPILALQRLRRTIDPKTLRGTVLMIHTANVPSFLGRTIYYSPIDGQNLNRVFPGKADGTLSERLAHVITREVIARATHVLDLHGGDGNEQLRPYAYWITSGDPAVADASRELALAFGLERIVVDDERPTDAAVSLYLSNTAITRGKPAVTTEAGGLGQTDETAIALIERGVAGVLRHLGMRNDGPSPLAAPVWITKNVVLRAHETGLFFPAVSCGEIVAAEAAIGHITDFHGRVLEEIVAPFAGEILYVVRTPPMTIGEPIAMIGAA